MKQKSKPDGATVDLVRRGIVNANTGSIDKNKAIKAGIILPKKSRKGGMAK
jgi:hypothetical protein